MKKIYTQVVKYRKAILVLFILAAALSALMKPLVGVNYDMKDYLPEDSSSTVSLNIMGNEFENGIPNARIMLKNITIAEALHYKEQIENIKGVSDVQWLDDSVMSITMPLSFMDTDVLHNYYKVDNTDKTSGTALMTVTIDKAKILTAVPEIRRIIGNENCMTGDAVSTATATKSTVSEISRIAGFAVLMVLLILIITTRSWLEPVVVLASIGIAIIINAGTNLIFGEISFVTNAAGSILQLAVSLDYSVFLMHRFEECKSRIPAESKGSASDTAVQTVSKSDTAASAMVEALCKSTGSIASSGLTTVVGFLALVLMKFQIGPDMGLALAKGIAISLLTVFTFTPALILAMHGLIDKTRHRAFLPDFKKFGRLVMRITIPAACIFVLAIIPAFALSNSNSHYYGSSHIFANDTQVGSDKEEIVKEFGKKDTYALMVPKGDTVTEDKLTAALEDIPQVTEIKSYGETLSSIVPYEAMPDNISSQLISDDYSRMALSVNVDFEVDETFALVKKIRETAHEYYGNDYLLAGEGVSTCDLMETTTADTLKVNIVAIAAVLLVLIIMLRSLLLPVILVLSIETAIWINVAIPAVMGDHVFYIAYLIISSVQLGATVDYAILMTNRYRENRLRLNKRNAVVETIRNITPSIITSGSALAIVGFLLGFISTHQLLAQLGVFVGRGAICSLAIVLFVLPGLLYTFDRFCTGKK